MNELAEYPLDSTHTERKRSPHDAIHPAPKPSDRTLGGHFADEMKTTLYVIPAWCELPLSDHNDGLGGCWGISTGLVEQTAGRHCDDCEYKRGGDPVHGETVATPAA